MASTGAGGSNTGSRSLQDTPTWALATVCFVFIFISIIIENLIHLLSQWLKKHRKNALLEAVERLKSVLMLLGFMSLILTVTRRYISKICIPTKVADSMLPCSKSAVTKTIKALGHENTVHTSLQGRLLASSETSASLDSCQLKGKASLISQDGLNQLSIFIFVLAVMQIVYSVITMALGRAKMRRWIAWEIETQTVAYQAANDSNRFRFTKQTTFGRRHMTSSTRSSLLLWIKCFFRQFFNSVAKVDYLTLRHGFISAHLSTNNSFNFQKYVQRSLEDDFKVVVGIRPFMWLLVVIFLLVDVHGSKAYLWISFLPIIIVLVLGTKLEVIVANMALEIQNQSSVIKGTPLVQPNDSLFWFNRPKFVLTLLHYTLFINAFEMAFFVWVTTQYGIKSCYHENVTIIIIRAVLTVTVQVMCSYITLPLYALVTQMGSSFKSAVLEEQTINAIRQWHNDVKVKQKQKRSKKPDMSQNDPESNSSTTTSSLDLSSRRGLRSLTLAGFTTTTTTTTHRKPAFLEEIELHHEIVPLEDTSHVVEIQMPARGH